MRFLKMYKNRNKLLAYFHNILHTNIGTERLALFFVATIVIGHVFTCIWILLAYIDQEMMIEEDGTIIYDWPEHSVNWITVNQLQSEAKGSLYTIAFYFMIETITTVGYGDFSATSSRENIFLIILMVLGVISFSYATGALSSIITSIDSRQAS